MVVRRGKPFTSQALLFNIGGAGLVGLGVILAIWSSFAPAPQTPLCETRYSGGALFTFARSSGEALAPEDLQARLGGLDRGLLENSRIVKDAAVPFGHALEIQLKVAKREDDEQSRSGIGFIWLPQRLALASAACLSYSIWTPADFKPGDGGVLPGFLSESAGESAVPAAPAPSAEQREAKGQEGEGQAPAALKPFSTRPYWRGDGTLLVWQSPNIGQPRGFVVDPAKAMLKPGRWLRLEEEVVLNTPGKADGILRFWVDGKLVLEQPEIGFRQDEMQSLQAIVGDIHNVRHGAWSASPTDTRIRISPLELRMR